MLVSDHMNDVQLIFISPAMNQRKPDFNVTLVFSRVADGERMVVNRQTLDVRRFDHKCYRFSNHLYL